MKSCQVFLLLIISTSTIPHQHGESSDYEHEHEQHRRNVSAYPDLDNGFLSDSSRFSTHKGTPWTFSSNAARSRIVDTKYGRIQGLSVTLFTNMHYTGNRNFPLKNKIVEIFFGIPYAAPPTKSYRFSPTQTPIPWNDVKPTIQPSPVCPQIFPDIRNESAALREMPKGYLEYLRRIEPYLRNQSEDCLYLNVFSPIGPDAKPKPVLVYIHGGMFAWGSGSLVDGTVAAAYSDVVFVTLNYRLGILGFLNLNESPSSRPRVSNHGLMDQIAALHWIKENIRMFGGDPDAITLMGYEAGAAAINFLMASPTVASGLFHRTILIAGSSLAPWALIQEPWVAGQGVAQALNCSVNSTFSSGMGTGMGDGGTTSTASPSSSMDPVTECLKTKHFSEFTKFPLPKFSVDFGPSVDGIVVKSNFKTTTSSQMKREIVSKKYDALLGLSSLERLTEFSEMDLEFGFESQRRDAIFRTLVRNSYRYHRNEILATVTNEYIDWERTAQHPISTRDLAVNAVTDSLSLAPVVAITESNQIKKSFFFVFEHSTKDGIYNYHRAGAGGGEELNYIWGYPLVEFATGQVLPFIPQPLPSNYSKGEVALSELWMTLISNFVRSGNPNGPIKIDGVSSWPVSKERNRYKNSAWEPYDRLHQRYLEIGANKIRTKSHYKAHQMAIWLRLVPELQRSGAQMAATFHNRMRGGNDPMLYTGRLKHSGEDEGDESPDLSGLGGASLSNMNPALLYDLLLGYAEDHDDHLQGEGSSPTDPKLPAGKGPTLTMTTCYSPVSSSVQSGRNGSGVNGTSFFQGTSFPPYSVILAITIAVGCSLLILNICIFALVYCQRSRRAKTRRYQHPVSTLQSSIADTEHPDSTTSSQKFYGEPPELLKSNRTTATSFLQNSQTHLQTEIEALEALELTVKQHQQELLGEKALLTMEAVQGLHQSFSTHTLPYHTTNAVSSSPSVSLSTTDQSSSAIATLPRCNGGISSFLGAVPSTRPVLTSTHGTLRRGQRPDISDNYNSDSNNENDELKV